MCLAGRTCSAAQAGLEVAYTDPLDCLPPKDWDRKVCSTMPGQHPSLLRAYSGWLRPSLQWPCQCSMD